MHDDHRNIRLVQRVQLGQNGLALHRADDNTGHTGQPEIPQALDLCVLVAVVDRTVVNLDVEAVEILPHQFNAAAQIRRCVDDRQYHADRHLLLLIVERLGQRIGLVAVLLEQRADLLALGIAHARTIVNDLVHGRFMYTRHIGDLFECDSHNSIPYFRMISPVRYRYLSLLSMFLMVFARGICNFRKNLILTVWHIGCLFSHFRLILRNAPLSRSKSAGFQAVSVVAVLYNRRTL